MLSFLVCLFMLWHPVTPVYTVINLHVIRYVSSFVWKAKFSENKMTKNQYDNEASSIYGSRFAVS